MNQAGIENVVANSGTAITDQQIKLLSRYCKNVTLVYDSDEAGLRATLRAIPMFLKTGIAIKVLLLPDGEDPDSYIRKTASSNVQTSFENNEHNFIDFMYSVLVKNILDPDLRSSGMIEILNTIAVIPSPITQESYLQECSRVTGYSVEAIKDEMRRL